VIETGRPERVYIQRYPDGTDRRLISASAIEPLWSPTGRELFYRSIDGREMWTVPVDPVTGDLGTPEMLFSGPYRPSPNGFWTDYDVTSDGQTFLMIRVEDSAQPEILHVVVNALAGVS